MNFYYFFCRASLQKNIEIFINYCITFFERMKIPTVKDFHIKRILNKQIWTLKIDILFCIYQIILHLQRNYTTY